MVKRNSFIQSNCATSAMKWIVLFCTVVCLSSAKEYSDGSVDLSYTCVSLQQDGKHSLPPIILLHGLSGDKSHWKDIYTELALQTKRMVCMSDARNHGQSPKTEEFSIDLMAADTSRMMDNLNVSKAFLIGQSMGGKTASVTALKYPDRVEKVVSEDMRPNSITSEALTMVRSHFDIMKRSLDAVPEGASDQEAREAITNFLKKVMGKTMVDDIKEYIINMVVCESGKYRYRIDMDFIQKLLEDPAEVLTQVYDGRFDGDALFIYGALSPFKVGEAEEEIRPLFPKAQLVSIEGAGHPVHQEKPREFLSAVMDFVNANE